MFDFEKPNIEIAEISEDKKYGKFVVEPLERGYGTTLGNSLRRIMLSSLPGSAVSQVKIDGVLHEFSSISGVKEDVTEIIMNVKSLAIKNNSDTNEPKTAYIEFEGEGVITAADIQADADIEILNPEQVIATLSGGADSKFYMELTITKGRGYISALSDYGYPHGDAAELLVYVTGNGDPAAIASMWMNAETQRAMILNGGFSAAGIGVYQADGMSYVVCLLVG